MKLRNKKTGEIGWLETYHGESDEKMIAVLDEKSAYRPYNSLAELNEVWEDYREQERMQWVDVLGANDGRVVIQYSNEEEVKKVVEKLKAWTRLENKGFRFKMWEYDDKYATEFPCILIRATKIKNCEEDLDLLFGGEE